MTDITLTDAQTKAIAAIKDWFLNSTAIQQVFRVFGPAGVGKSELVKHAIADLGLDASCGPNGIPDVLYGTFTGKAAYVLRCKGVPCRTIHSLIYAVHEATEEELADVKAKLDIAEMEARGLSPGLERTLADAKVEALRMELKNMKRPRFALNEDSDVRDCKLLVLDEVSMVGSDMAADVLSFGKPILVLGDPGQLPPIKGDGAFTDVQPDVMLTEIHRQANESAIIRLATMARTHKQIPYGQHDDSVWKMSRRDVMPAQLLRGGQVICGRNVTRLELNNAMRRQSGFTGDLPSGPAEKIICLKNDNQRGLINGMFVKLSEIEAIDDDRFEATVVAADGGADVIGGSLRLYAGHFLDHVMRDPERLDRDWKLRKPLVEATYGWAITCHKSQGSAWENIIIWDDHLGKTKEDRARWLYTAITRAESGLVILD
jgi:exodeoxyribonuclease-5